MPDRELTITKLERHQDHGYWIARVTVPGYRPAAVDCRAGSWQVAERDGRRDLAPWVAARLQDKVRPLERSERAAIAEQVHAERVRRHDAFRRDELRPSAEDVARYDAEVEAELVRELHGLTLERIYREPALRWAWPATWHEQDDRRKRLEYEQQGQDDAERHERARLLSSWAAGAAQGHDPGEPPAGLF